jgi:hypothetical protein
MYKKCCGFILCDSTRGQIISFPILKRINMLFFYQKIPGITQTLINLNLIKYRLISVMSIFICRDKAAGFCGTYFAVSIFSF